MQGRPASRGPSLARHTGPPQRQGGPHLVVVFNGQKTVDAQDSKHAGGYIALQYGSGVVKFRRVQIKPL